LTVTEILAWVLRKYPHQESNANCIIDLDMIHKEIYLQLKRLKNETEVHQDLTVADQLEYVLPPNCSADNIVSVYVSNDTAITSTTEFDLYTYKGLRDSIDNGNHYTISKNNKIALADFGEPIDTSSYPIHIYYYKTPAKITAVGDTPELESIYHHLLCFKLIQRLASQGDVQNPDVADYWQNEYMEAMDKVTADLMGKFSANPYTGTQIEEWF